MERYMGELIDIQCCGQHGCVLAGVKFKPRDLIKVRLAKSFDPEVEAGSGGTWGWGGYTAQQIKSVANTIIDAQTGTIIWRR